ncbi:uncharacterized protein LOC130965731 [Arachis stenosperma]|uniref:uncharacterized protein LOC130965731 n=1 Tax=Arachis stenosperma TaxID=217475 RepID=UPI0025AD7C8D|nr:uncharacterized protein LOC130965731 [Arachis stenosperma]
MVFVLCFEYEEEINQRIKSPLLRSLGFEDGAKDYVKEEDLDAESPTSILEDDTQPLKNSTTGHLGGSLAGSGFSLAYSLVLGLVLYVMHHNRNEDEDKYFFGTKLGCIFAV